MLCPPFVVKITHWFFFYLVKQLRRIQCDHTFHHSEADACTTLFLVAGNGSDSLVMYGTPIHAESFVVDFGNGQNELLIDFSKIGSRAIKNVFHAMAIKSGSKANDTLVFTAELTSVHGVHTHIQKTTIDIDAFRITQQGVTERSYLIGDAHTLELTDTTARPFFVDNQGSAKVTVQSSSICRDEKKIADVKAVNLEGDQSLVVDFTSESQGVVVYVLKNKIVVNFGFGTDDCTVPYGFSKDITLLLTNHKDVVYVSALITKLTVFGNDGDDTLHVHKTSSKSTLWWDGGAGQNEVVIGDNNEAEGTTSLEAAGGSNHAMYTVAPANEIKTPGLVTLLSTSPNADVLDIFGLNDDANVCQFVDQITAEQTKFVHADRDLIVFTGAELTVKVRGGKEADSVAVDMMNSILELDLLSGDDFVTVGKQGAGALDRGNQESLKVRGGRGNDNVTVYSNDAPIHIDGEEGTNDSFDNFVYSLETSSMLLKNRFEKSKGVPKTGIDYSGIEALRIEFMASGTASSTLLVASTYAGAHNAIISNGNKITTFNPTTNIAGKSVVLHGLPSDHAIFDAKQTNKNTACQLRKGADFELDVIDAAMPAYTASLNGVGHLTVHMSEAFADTVDIYSTVMLETTVHGHGGEDSITAYNMADTSTLFVYGGADSDVFTAIPDTAQNDGQLSTIFVNGVGDAVFSKDAPAVLDQVRIHSFNRGGYDITVLDDDNGVELKLFGSDDHEDYLLRKGLIVQMNDRDTANLLESVHYTDNHVERLTIEGKDGDDQFIVDTTGDVEIYLYGNDGNDVFIFGQVYTSKRDGEANLTIAEQAQVSVQRTSLGYLSTGNLAPLRAYGMNGDG